MSKTVWLVFLFFSWSGVSYSQSIDTNQTESTAPVVKTLPFPEDISTSNSLDVKPMMVGLGTGMFSFYGDLYKKNFQNPMTSRIGFDLNISQELSPALQLSFYALFGKLGANEQQITRNLNFESQIRAGGINLLYNFDHFLPKERIISPFTSIGLESLEYLSKIDLLDKNGNRYYYWSDGSIKNIDEKNANASNATNLQRDYTYESDIRELNADNFGKYPERSFAIPLGVGAILKLSERTNFKIGTTLHYTFTDYIDGVTEKSIGNRKGNNRNDIFMMTGFSIQYKLTGFRNENDTIDESYFKDVDYLALAKEDSDNDGINDGDDACQGTPPGVPVDSRGCPLDGDKDGVPDYLDQELKTPEKAIVNAEGVQLTDSLILQQYLTYTDSTGQFALAEKKVHGSKGGGRGASVAPKEYTIQLGEFKSGLSPDLMTKFLSIGDVTNTNTNDSTTVYTAGIYKNYGDAEKRKNELIKDGIPDAKIVYKKNGMFIEADAPIALVDKNGKKTKDAERTKTTPADTATTPVAEGKIEQKGVVFRVQLGAYSKKLSKNVFRGIDDLVEIKTDDSLYKYMTGAFSNFGQAAKHKMEMLLKGYEGAFIAAYKDGKRVSLESVGATPTEKVVENIEETHKPINAVDKKLVTFKVQVGVYKNEAPKEMLKKYESVKDIQKELTITGLTRYVTASFNEYNAAFALKNELIKKGISDAFIIASFNNQYITVQEALELIK